MSYGDRFLEIGHWRLGAERDFVVSHKEGETAQVYKEDLTQIPGPWLEDIDPKGPALGPSYSAIYGRPKQYHCGSIESIFGSCAARSKGLQVFGCAGGHDVGRALHPNG